MRFTKALFATVFSCNVYCFTICYYYYLHYVNDHKNDNEG